ncbi:MAG: hypothetical protein ACI4TJ_06415 [Candidatus Cryptobacteroides sp.]
MRRFLTFAALALAILGCTEKPHDDGGDIPEETLSITATFEAGGMEEWLGGDKLSIFTDDKENHQFLYRGQSTFALLGEEALAWKKGTSIHAVYPYRESNSIGENGLIQLNVPQTQAYRRNAVAQHMNPMVAVSRSGNLDFKNVCGYLKVKITGYITLKSARLLGNNGEKIAGEAFVRADIGGIPAVEMSPDAVNEISIDCGKGIWAGNTSYESAVLYFVLPPTSFTKGLTLVLESSTGTVHKSRIIDPVSIERGCTTELDPIDFSYVPDHAPLSFRSDGPSTLVLKKYGYPDDVHLYCNADGEWMPYSIGQEISLSDGETVSFRAMEEGNSTFSRSATDFYRFEGTGSLEATGSIMALLDAEMSASEIPAEYCFYGLFSGMTALTRAPELTSRTTKPHCYDNLFNGCSRLSYIKALFLTSPADGSFTSGWVEGVNPEGTFSMSPDASWSHSGPSGIPQGWTVLDMPEDNDSNYYESIEYLTPSMTGYSNSLKAEQKNSKDPSEWTYTTLGRDPFIPMNALRKQAEGPVLVFQYKSTAPVFCEFFWCTGGYGVKGPAGGIETGFNLEATREWKTFTMNMEGEWQKFSFEGRPGDTVRFDIGNGSGVTVVVRLMRWRKATSED